MGQTSLPFFALDCKQSLPRRRFSMAAPLRFLRFKGFKREQSFQKIVLAVNQHAIVGPCAAAMAENSRRRRISATHRRKVAVNQRLRDALALPMIKSSKRITQSLIDRNLSP